MIPGPRNGTLKIRLARRLRGGRLPLEQVVAFAWNKWSASPDSAAQGVRLDRGTLGFWVKRAAWWLKPVYERLLGFIRSQPKAFCDETRLPRLDPGRGRTKICLLWGQAVDDRPWCGPAPPAVGWVFAENGLISSLDEETLDRTRAELAIGLHWNVDVTTVPTGPRPRVSQAFCSALPVAYNQGIAAQKHWQVFASLVLDAAYEATLLAGAINAQHGGTNQVLLTLLGGRAFGNHEDWILSAMKRAVGRAHNLGLDVIVVSYGAPSIALERFNRR